jgi:enterochelin esterase-like enzyme
VAFVTWVALATPLAAQVQPLKRWWPQVRTEVPPVVPGAKPATVERVKIHGTALEGNLEGNAVDRDAIIFLPPSYAKEKSRRYPVVYALHGYSIGAEQWAPEIHVPQTLEGAFAQGAQEVIVVLPDSKTVHNGSMYSSSVTTGDFERYVMSPCCLSPRGAGSPGGDIEKSLEAVKTPADSAGLPFFARAQLASAAAWSPDPNNPPLYLQLPTRGGEPQADVLAKWAANAPLAFLDQYVGNLRRYRAIAIDVGDQDRLRADAEKLHEALDRYGIANTFEVYPGTHTSRVADRFQNHVMPFFSRSLCAKGDCP